MQYGADMIHEKLYTEEGDWAASDEFKVWIEGLYSQEMRLSLKKLTQVIFLLQCCRARKTTVHGKRKLLTHILESGGEVAIKGMLETS